MVNVGVRVGVGVSGTRSTWVMWIGHKQYDQVMINKGRIHL